MGTPRNLYGMGFSPLSIKNKAHAFEEEMLANKDAGLTAYMMNGNVISAEFIARSKEQLKLFTSKCIRDNTIGEIYKIGFTDELIKTVVENTNLFDNTISYQRYGEANKPINMRFDMDFDVFDTENSTPADLASAKVRVEFTMGVNGITKNYFLEENLNEFSDKVFALDWSSLEEAARTAPVVTEPEEPVVDPETPAEEEPATDEPVVDPENPETEPTDPEEPVTDPDMPTESVIDPEEPSEPAVEDPAGELQLNYTLTLNTFEVNVGSIPENRKFVIYNILFGLV